MTFTRNLRAIIFESRPLLPSPLPNTHYSATADEAPLATYSYLQSGVKHLRDESTTHAGPHTDVSQIVKYRKKRGWGGSQPTQYKR
jgi:hypothetical protein